MTATILRHLASAPPLTGPGPTSTLLILVVLGALLLAAGALVASIRAISELVAELLRTLFANVGALLLIGLVLACVVVLALSGVGADGAPPTPTGAVG